MPNTAGLNPDLPRRVPSRVNSTRMAAPLRGPPRLRMTSLRFQRFCAGNPTERIGELEI
jgi:hypothetical protein